MYYWKGGRLTNGKISISATTAYNLIHRDPEIAKACKGVLIPWGTWEHKKRIIGHTGD